MALADEARAVESVRGPRCQVCTMLDDDVLGDELADALDDGGLTAASIATALTARGYDIAEYTLARHRRGRCRGTR